MSAATDKIVQALRDILDPIAYIERGLQEGERLNGQAALQQISSREFYIRIATAALAEFEAEKAQPAPEPTQQTVELTAEQIEAFMPAATYHNGFGRSPDLWSLEQVAKGVSAILAAGRADAQHADRVDAERYRWLRSEHKRFDPLCHLCWKIGNDRSGHAWCNTADLDAAIDAAMLAARAEKGGT